MLTRSFTLLVFLGFIYLSAVSKITVVASNSTNLPRTSPVFGDNKQFYIHRKERNWHEAIRSCESMGYKLISFNTTKKWNAVHSYLDSQKDKWHYWTSGNDFLTLDLHVWSPSGMAVPSEYWSSGQPDNYLGIEHCDEFRYNGGKLMNDIDCTFLRFYICERTY